MSGVGIDAVFRPATLSKFVSEVVKTISLVGVLSISCLILSIAFPQYLVALVFIHLSVAVGLVIQDIRKIILSRKYHHLISLLEDVERYNSAIKGIDINDQIESAGNPGVALKDRNRVIEALQLTREDIVRALKTERILRENQKFIKLNPELFANNLTALAALQVHDQASEYGRFLNEAFQIGLSIQDEMKQLKSRHLSK